MIAVRCFFREHRVLLLIILLSLLLKIVCLLQGKVVNPDSATYISAAEKYAQGLFAEGIRYYPMPFYPLLLTATHIAIPDWILAGRLLTVIPLVLVMWPLYVLTRRLFDHHSALWTALLYAVLPVFNAASSSIIRDPLFLLFVISALSSLIVCCQERQVKALIGFILFTVLAVLTRIEGVLLFLTAIVVFPVYWRRSQKSRLLLVLSVAGMFSIPIALIFIILGLEMIGISTGSRLPEVLLFVKQLFNLELFAGYQQLLQALKELQQTLPGAALHNNLLEVARHYAPVIYVLGLIEMLVTAVFPTSLLALFAFRWRSKEHALGWRWLILLPWIGFIQLNVLFLLNRNFTTERYLWVPIILSLPWIGYGVSLWRQNWQQRKIVATLVIMLIIMAPLSKTVVVAAKVPDTTVVKACHWLRDYDPQQQMSILYNDRRLPLYADRVSEVTKIRNLDYLRKSAYRHKGVELVALYLSNKKGENYDIQGFELFKEFKGEKKIVIFLKRWVE